MIPQIPKEDLHAIARERSVTDSEFEALYRALAGESNQEIADAFGISEIAVRKRLGEVYRKFEILGRNPGKLGELKRILLTEYQRYQQNRVERQDLAEAPSLSEFYGRTEELATLKQWIVEEKCRLVAVSGMEGMGKTTLVRHLTEQIKDQFEFIIWRSLAAAPSLNDLLENVCTKFPHVQDIPTDEDAKIDFLLDDLNKNRCLLILDSVEAILKRGDSQGNYQEKHQNYRNFFVKVGLEVHQSCLIITSLELPRPFARFRNNQEQKLKSLKPLESIDKDAASKLLNDFNLKKSKEWDILINTYNQSPLKLNRIARIIKELFDGDVKSFIELTRDTIILDELDYEILEQQYARLSDCEKRILEYLTPQPNPLSSTEIIKNLNKEGYLVSELTESLIALKTRGGYLETENGREATFTPNPILKKYIERKYIDKKNL